MYRWQDDRLFRFMSPGKKIRVCDFGESFHRKLIRYHGEVDSAAFQHDLVNLASRTPSTRALYRPAASLYFQHFHAASLRPTLVNHCARLCILAPWQIQRIFGDHRMIVSVRDPRAVFSSLEHKRNQTYDEANAFLSHPQREGYRLPNPVCQLPDGVCQLPDGVCQLPDGV